MGDRRHFPHYAKRLALSSMAVFAFQVAAEFVAQHGFLRGLHHQADIWRPREETAILFPMVIGVIALESVLASALYLTTRFKYIFFDTAPPSKTFHIRRGVAFGAMIGAMMGLVHAGMYPFLPVPAGLAIGWLIAATLEGIGMGLVLAMVNNAMDRA
jgi:hypothetical protein